MADMQWIKSDPLRWISLSGVGGAPAFVTTSLPAVTPGSNAPQQIVVTGAAPVSFAVTGGALPPGRSLNTATGEITGTFTTAGTWVFEVTANNILGSTKASFSQLVATTIPGPTGNEPAFATGATLADGTAGATYSATVNATGTPTPSYSLTYSNAPGAAVNASTGVLSTSALGAGTYTATVRATNSGGFRERTFSWTVRAGAPDPIARRRWIGPGRGGIGGRRGH